MKRKARIAAKLFFVLLIQGSIALAQQEPVPMPPGFTLSADPEKTLAAYPLGAINKEVAFSHHGKANKEVTLPNGNTGWLYDVGGREWHKAYMLVIDKDGIVNDVIYYDHGRFAKYGLTALQVQSVGLFPKSPTLGPGPE